MSQRPEINNVASRHLRSVDLQRRPVGLYKVDCASRVAANNFERWTVFDLYGSR